MNIQKPLRFTAAAVSAVLVSAGIAELPKTQTRHGMLTAIAAESTLREKAEEKADAKWWKAEITDYDSSLSLVSYELTPETAGKEEKAEQKTSLTNKGTGKETSEIALDDTAEAEVHEVPEIEIQSGQTAFITYGWGHGVGMSQNGGNFYALYEGWTYQEILQHYYPGTYLMNTGTAQSESVSAGEISGDVLSVVAGIVYREACGMSTEMLKAQAVAVYTYIKYFGNDANDLRCKANPPQEIIDACSSVLGEALYYDGNYALTMFSASSGGTTASCNDVFTDDIPYLRSVESKYDAEYDPHYGTVCYWDSSEVKRLVESAYGVSLSDDPNEWFDLKTGDSGYIREVEIGGQVTIRGTSFQSLFGLKSSKFDIVSG